MCIRLAAILAAGDCKQILCALSVAAELGLAIRLRPAIFSCCSSAHAKVRSKAVLLLGSLPPLGNAAAGGEAASILSAALGENDARVRASAVEAIEQLGWREFDEALAWRALHGQNRERANAIKALAGRRCIDAESALRDMLRDRRDAHRLSALWVTQKRREMHLVEEVARIARDDINVRVRGCAATMLHSMLRLMLSGDRRARSRAA